MKTIVHLHPTVYKDSSNKPGLGDFIRGSIFLAQYAEKNNMLFEISFENHPINKYIESSSKRHFGEILEFYGAYDPSKILKQLDLFRTSDESEILLSCNMFYEGTSVSQSVKDYINSVLKFKERYLETALTIIQEPYHVIHIRCRDNATSNDIYSFYLNMKLNDVLDSSGASIVMSNNPILRKTISKSFNIDETMTKPAHTSHSTDLEGTVLDYIVLSRASKISCFSFYHHGTGFSEQCAFLNNIPIASFNILSNDEFYYGKLPSKKDWSASVEYFNYCLKIRKSFFNINSNYDNLILDPSKEPVLSLWEFVNNRNKEFDAFFIKRMSYGFI